MRNVRRFANATMVGAVLAGVVFVAGSVPALAAPLTRIDVFPGPNALATALAQANPGDTLVLHAGTYSEAVTISTANLTIEPAGDGAVTIDGMCSAVAAVNIRADGVKLLGPITVVGGKFYELNYLGQTTGSVNGFTLTDTCNGTFGLFLQDTGAVSATELTISGFAGGGIELFGVAATDTGTGRALIARNDVFGTGRGIHVENSAGGTIVIRANHVHDNTFSGIDLVNSDGVLIRANRTLNDGSDGIALDANSDGNRVVRNTAKGNTFDLSNAGTGNCFVRNRFHTSEGDIGC